MILCQPVSESQFSTTRNQIEQTPFYLKKHVGHRLVVGEVEELYLITKMVPAAALSGA